MILTNSFYPSNKIWMFLILFFPNVLLMGQNESMYIMKSGFVEQEINVVTDVDSIIFYEPFLENSSITGLVLMNDGKVLSQYKLKTEVDSVVFIEPTATVERANYMLEGIYWMLNAAQFMPTENFFFASELASDDRLGGGGHNDHNCHGLDHLLKPSRGLLIMNWEMLYKGIYRANNLLSMIDEIEDFSSTDQKKQMQGEVLFLRAFFFFQLTTLHGEIPLPLTLEFEPLASSPVDDIFAQIASDLKLAIEVMPSSAYDLVKDGHATKWVAQAFMARVFLFYTGFYQVSDLPLKEGSVVSKDLVVSWLNDCIENSGHQLVEDFHELWPYTNHYTIDDYEYIQSYMDRTGKTLQYASDLGARNPESMFAMKFYTDADWDLDRARSNQFALYFGLRGLQSLNNTFPFAGGWGMGTVAPNLVADWVAENPEDLRLWASVLNIEEELSGYEKGLWDFVQETDFNQKKCMSVAAIQRFSDSSIRYVNNYSVMMNGNQDNNQLSAMSDLMLIRFADALLMMSELTEDAQYMNRVRARVDLDPVVYTLENLQKERRWELAFEGLRWNDIRRWHIAAEALDKQTNVPIYNFGILNENRPQSTAGYGGRYNVTNGFFPIPQVAIDQSEGLLQQVDGWDSEDAQFHGYQIP